MTSQVIDDDTNEYEYDANGNRTMEGYVTGVGNQILSDGIWTYEYDLEGNLIKKSKGEEDETWEYGYDHDNRLLWAEKALTDGGVVRTRVEYTYDVFGNRIKQLVEYFDEVGDPDGDETTRYAFMGQQVWADLDEAGDIVTRYLLGEAFGERYARSGDGDTFWLLTDRLGSTREILDETGVIVDEIGYDAFGNVISETEPALGLAGDYLFTGLRWFVITGLYGTPNRDYNPTIGKWLQNDFIGFNGGLMNLYGYVGNNGTNATDLSGLQLSGGLGGPAQNNRFPAQSIPSSGASFGNGQNGTPNGPAWQSNGKPPGLSMPGPNFNGLKPTPDPWNLNQNIDDNSLIPLDKKWHVKQLLAKLISARTFRWDKSTGFMGRCYDWVDEYQKRVSANYKEELKDLNQYIRFEKRYWNHDHVIGWAVGSAYIYYSWMRLWFTDDMPGQHGYNPSGHAAIRISITGGDWIYVDDGTRGGVFRDVPSYYRESKP